MAFNRLTRGTAVFGGVVATGNDRTRGIKSTKRTSATVADGASMTATAAHIVTNTIVSATPTTGRNLTTAIGSAIIALMPDAAVGDCTEFTVINLAPTTHALTLTAGVSGVTLVGSATVAAASSATWIVRYDSSTAVTFYRK
jgi:hypothetical protein